MCQTRSYHLHNTSASAAQRGQALHTMRHATRVATAHSHRHLAEQSDRDMLSLLLSFHAKERRDEKVKRKKKVKSKLYLRINTAPQC